MKGADQQAQGSLSLIEGPVDIQIESHADGRAFLEILVWTGQFPTVSIFHERWSSIACRWRSPSPAHLQILAEVLYAGTVIFFAAFNHDMRCARAVVSGLAIRPVPDSFKLLHSENKHDSVRARIVVHTQPKTKAERLADRLWAVPESQPPICAKVSDLVKLRRALLIE